MQVGASESALPCCGRLSTPQGPEGVWRSCRCAWKPQPELAAILGRRGTRDTEVDIVFLWPRSTRGARTNAWTVDCQCGCSCDVAHAAGRNRLGPPGTRPFSRELRSACAMPRPRQAAADGANAPVSETVSVPVAQDGPYTQLWAFAGLAGASLPSRSRTPGSGPPILCGCSGNTGARGLKGRYNTPVRFVARALYGTS